MLKKEKSSSSIESHTPSFLKIHLPSGETKHVNKIKANNNDRLQS